MLLLIAALFSLNNVNAKDKADSTQTVAKSIFNLKNTRNYSKKGKFYVHWGYNFSSYSKSDINFTGPGYNFTLKNVHAADRPTKLSSTYINPSTITIPQFNFHAGYYIKDNYTISIGWDHMKYVVNTPQMVKISGHIDNTISNPGIDASKYAGTYDNADFEVTEEFLKFEHTDGYNFATVALERHDDVWVAKNQKQSLSLETGVDVGLLVPRTDSKLLGVGENHYWNVAGWGASAKVGAKFFFTKRLFLQGSYKVGFTDLNNIRTTGRKGIDKAKQNITFFENYYVLGFLF